MRRTYVKKKNIKVTRTKGEWDKAISAVDEKLAMATERVQNLKEIRERFVSFKSEGVAWPAPATQN